MYYVGICDSDRNNCSLLEDMLLKYAKQNLIKLEVGIWYNGESICKYLEKGNSIDILFLDVELIKLSGIQVGKFIRNYLSDREMQIIYISEKKEYALGVFKIQPTDFLLKPIFYNKIEETMDLVVEILGKGNKRFQFQYGKEYYFIPLEEIMYFMSNGRKISIITVRGEKYFYDKMKDILPALPPYFLMIHQSYIINKNFVERYTYDMVELIDGTMLTISKANRKKVRDWILQGE